MSSFFLIPLPTSVIIYREAVVESRIILNSKRKELGKKYRISRTGLILSVVCPYINEQHEVYLPTCPGVVTKIVLRMRITLRVQSGVPLQ